MAKIVLDDVSNTPNMFVGVNSNSAKIETAFENTLSRDGTGPNHMIADLNMNGYNIINQGNPVVVEGIEWKGDWVPSLSYKVGDIVLHPTGTYIAIVAHTSGDFPTDLINNRWQMFVPTPDQVNADWNATEGVAEILNKPTIITPVNADWNSGSGLSEILNKPTIPDAQVNVDWDSTSGITQILNKPNPVILTTDQTISGNKTFNDLIIPNSTKGIKGTTTNNDAQAGSIGEFVSSVIPSGSMVALTSTVPTNLTSLSLTAGDWEVRGVVIFRPASSTSITLMQVSVSPTSATISLDRFVFFTGSAFVPNFDQTPGQVPTTRFSLSTTTTVYCVCSANFTVSTLHAFGGFYARRIR